MFKYIDKYHQMHGAGIYSLFPWRFKNRLTVLVTFALSMFLMLLTAGKQLEAQDVNEIRHAYFNMEEDDCRWKEVAAEIADSSNPVLLAYQGAMLAASANCTEGALNKLKQFKQGKQKLEKAVNLNPVNAEIRFLRYSVKVKTPGILNYNDTESDKQFIISKLSGKENNLNEFLLHEICSFMLNHGDLNDGERTLIEDIYSKTSN